MPRIVALFNLKEGVTAQDYELWARSTDIPTVNGLRSIDGFSTHRATGLLAGEGEPPYQYIEIIDVNDMGVFGEDLSTPAMQQVAAEFQQFADNPCFILTQDL